MSALHAVCRAIEPDLLAVAAAEAGPDAVERVEEHVARCSGCREELQHYRAIEGLLGELRRVPPPGADPTFARAQLESQLTDLRSRLVRYGVFSSPLGPILIARSELGVSLIRYLAGPGSSAAAARRLLDEEAIEDRAAMEGLYAELVEYLEGRRTRFDWPLDLRRARSDFQRRVLEATAQLPYGAVASYAGIARRIGAPAGARPVAQALRWNPLPIVIPCHRVIGHAGDLVGYAGRRVGLKRQLLAIEGVEARPEGGDFRVRREAMYVLQAGEAEYCLPVCGSLASRPLSELLLFGSRARAEAAGLAPCAACRPDLHPLSSLPA
jgi:methylated-DNA-[protein]-cysteine S-methyltransferase